MDASPFDALTKLLADLKAAGGDTAAAELALAALQKAWPPADPFAPVNRPGVGKEADFIFKHTTSPFRGVMARYSEAEGNITGLLGYPTSFALCFVNNEPLLNWVIWNDQKAHADYPFANNARTFLGKIRAGERPIIALPLNNPVERWPNAETLAAAQKSWDAAKAANDIAKVATVSLRPANRPAFTLRELAQGPNGPAKAYFPQLRALVQRLVDNHIEADFRSQEHTGDWFPNSAKIGEAGWWILAMNHIGDTIHSVMPGAKMIWNAARQVSGGMAPLEDSVWISAADAAAMTATGLVGVVKAGTPLNVKVVSNDPYNGCYSRASQVTNEMTPAQRDAVLSARWKAEGGPLFDRMEAIAAKLGPDVKLGMIEWGTGWDDRTGIPRDAKGLPLLYNGKTGGDDPVYIDGIYQRALKWRKAGKLYCLGYWDRFASDAETALSFSSNVVHRTGKTPAPAGKIDMREKPLAAKAFVERFGEPSVPA
jgi:hypothetical protein